MNSIMLHHQAIGKIGGTVKLIFTCPSCRAKFAPIAPMNYATQIIRRTCRRCGERWQLRVQLLSNKNGLRMDQAEFVFLGRRKAVRS